MSFDPGCRACPRLAAFLDEVRASHPDYHCAPVPAFGDARPRLLIVGLAPGMHGANRTGRPFTGDFAGDLLYATLMRMGLARGAYDPDRSDDLELVGVRITNAVKCLPPGNRPTTAEVRRCNAFLAAEIAALPDSARLLALGRIAHDAVLRALGLTLAAFPFAHGARHRLPDGRLLVDSYHCSRYNTQTGRLTPSMFEQALARALA